MLSSEPNVVCKMQVCYLIFNLVKSSSLYAIDVVVKSLGTLVQNVIYRIVLRLVSNLLQVYHLCKLLSR